MKGSRYPKTDKGLRAYSMYRKVAVDHHNKMFMSDQFTNGPDITLTNFQIIEYEHLKKIFYWIKKK